MIIFFKKMEPAKMEYILTKIISSAQGTKRLQMISKCQYGETNIKLNDAKTSE
jgi:hypothetical protein